MEKLPHLFSFGIDTGCTLRQAKMSQQADMTMLFRPNLSIEAQQEFQQLSDILDEIYLQQGGIDVVHWKGHGTGIYTVKSAYRRLKKVKTDICKNMEDRRTA